MLQFRRPRCRLAIPVGVLVTFCCHVAMKFRQALGKLLLDVI